MSFKGWWNNVCHGRWNYNRLTSRKFLVTVAFFVAGLSVAFVLATVFHLNENSIVETGINAVRDVVIAWLAVQGASDFINKPGGDEQ